MADVAAVTRADILESHGESELNARIERWLHPQFWHQCPERVGWRTYAAWPVRVIRSLIDGDLRFAPSARRREVADRGGSHGSGVCP